MNSRVARQHVPRRSFRWLNLLVILAVLLLSINIGAQIQEYFALQSEIDHYQDKLAFVEAEYEKQALIQETLYDEETIEQMARERLGMVKEGEEVVSILEVETTDQAAVSQ